MNDLLETFTVVDGYDKRKTRATKTVRKFTLDDIRAMQTSYQREYLFLDRNGEVRTCRTNGKLKTWKTDPNRFERSFMYGMYENFRMNTQQMLNNLVVEV